MFFATSFRLDDNGFSMQKKFGQNFLINGAARTKLIDALDVKEGTTVWEVGPGLGAMTNELLERGTNLTAFEIDRGFISLISQQSFRRGKHRYQQVFNLCKILIIIHLNRLSTFQPQYQNHLFQIKKLYLYLIS